MQPFLMIIKVGGNIVDDAVQLNSFLQALATIPHPCILVHGGGKVATQIGDKLGIVSHYKDGRRITDDATIDLVTMVYGGLVNKKIVAALQPLGVNAIGVTGADANAIPATKRPVKTIDYGWVGDVDSANIPVAVWQQWLMQKYLPVVAPLTHDGVGHILNTNADTIAAALATALSTTYTVRLVYCFEKKGVLLDVANEASVITRMNRTYYQQLLNDAVLFDGILPKLSNAFAAIDSGVHEVLIGHANDIVQNSTAATIGTLITND